MKSCDKISIIILITNQINELDNCINSILKQDYKDKEIIVLDLLEYEEILNKYDNIKYFKIDKNDISYALNVGINNCNGNYLLFINGNDYLEDQMIDILYNQIINDKSDIVICDYHGRLEDNNYKNEYLDNEKYELLNDIKIINHLYSRLFKKSLFDNIYFPFGLNYEDKYIFHQILNNVHKITYIDKKLYYYTNHNKKEELLKNDYHLCLALLKRLEFFNKNNLNEYQNITYNLLKDKCYESINNHKNYIDYDKYVNEIKYIDNMKDYIINKDYKSIDEIKDIKVSIIVPVYNVEEYIRKTIESIINQSLKEIELILIDDGSIDNSKEIIKEYAYIDKRIKAYFISENKLITLMMKMDADNVVMTMPDLENMQIKKSYVRKDVNYIYVPHGMTSLNMVMRKGSMDNYNSIFVASTYQKEEIKKTEEVYNLPKKELVEAGYPLLDDMIRDYDSYLENNNEKNKIPEIIIAPSWQKDNIVDICVEEIVDNLLVGNYKIIVRPHPQHVKHMPQKMQQLKERYENNKNVIIQTDFTSSSVFESDLMISDWSGIAYEYAFATKKPVLFINTPMKVMNPEYEKIEIVPINITLRETIGAALELDELSKIKEKTDYLLKNAKKYKKTISDFVDNNIYNVGTSSDICGRYIVGQVFKQIEKRRNQN